MLVAKPAAAPIGAWAAGTALGLDGDLLDAVVIQSAMPRGVFCAVVATEHKLVPERVTAAVVPATPASPVTMPVVLLSV